MVIIAELLRSAGTKDSVNITLRGVEPDGFLLRPQLKVVEGRPFTTGLRELIVGRAVARQFSGASLGNHVRMRGSDWTVVGIFESGDSNESELWTDLNVAQTTFGRTGESTVRVGLDGAGGFDTLKTALSGDPQLTVDLIREQDYYSGQTKNFRQTIGTLAGVVTLIMALGATFAAVNSMYAAVATRGKEIATLRAIGFGAFPVLMSVMIEAMVLAIAGGVLGALITYVLFNNMSVSTLGQNFTQVVFSFKVTPALMYRGLEISILIGMIGALLPAIRAARLPVTTGLREL
jgi:putative ABC transport system permease protein